MSQSQSTTRVESSLIADLRDPAAQGSELTGGKAAALARASTAGLPTLPGLVLTTKFCAEIDGGADVASHPAVREVFDRAEGDSRELVARSSSVVEDMTESSAAGQFESVTRIKGFDEFAAAVQVVLDSRIRAAAANHPIAVLVQPSLEPAFGGVMFGVDPVTGRSDRRVVSAVRGAPSELVSGEVNGSRYVLDLHAKVAEFDRGDGASLSQGDLKRLVALSKQVEEVFGRPQDTEWAIGTDGKLWLLQSRPVTTEIRGVPRGPIYGPGPVAETFPEPLTELERDLWVLPLCEAVRESVVLAGTARRSEVNTYATVVCVEGHVGIDLKLSGDIRPKRSWTRNLNPISAVHRLRGAWRIGRLRAALPELCEHLADRTDADLEAVPAFANLSSRQLLALLHRGRAVLRALHAHEILIGMLTDTGQNRMTGASVALRVLVEARADGLNDADIIRRSPVVLAVTPPRIAPSPELPSDATAVQVIRDVDDANDNGILREALRLRVRWVQELMGRAAWHLGARLAADDDLPNAELIRHLTLEHVDAVTTKRAVFVPALLRDHEHNFGTPLPARFQISDLGKAIPVYDNEDIGGGTGAGGGVAVGPVTCDGNDPAPGAVLVTRVLTPNLGPIVGRLAGIVSETGSVLSHLAILAREAGVPTVVGYAGATTDLPPGTIVRVDGQSGEVTVLEEPAGTTPPSHPSPTDPSPNAATVILEGDTS